MFSWLAKLTATELHGRGPVRRHGPVSHASLVRRGSWRRTLFVRISEHDRAPQELWDIIVNGSDVLLTVESPDAEFLSLYADCVVLWNKPNVTIDGTVFQWPKHADNVRHLFEL